MNHSTIYKSLLSFFIILFSVQPYFSQGFSSTATNWSLPSGGLTDLGVFYSFYQFSYTWSSGDVGSQTWNTADINGDGKLDLVVTTENQSGTFKVYGLPSSPYWKVYLGTASGFSSTATSWSLPTGGLIDFGVNYGFNQFSYSAASGDVGTQNWNTTDINGDGNPDLVITRENQAGSFNVYGLPSSPYWKVYLGSGSGFSSTATNWSLPSGGLTDLGVFYSFYQFSYTWSSGDVGSQTWNTADINGDGKLDLVVTTENQSGTFKVYGLPSSPYWKVYLGTASGFSSTATSWSLPTGGLIDFGVNYGFNQFSYSAASGDVGTQNWNTTDINGDGNPDLVITRENQAGSFNVYGLPSSPYWKVYLNNSLPTSLELRSEKHDNLLLHPNPANNEAYISLNETDGNISYRIYSVTGQKMLSVDHFNAGTEKVNLTSLIPGIYFISITSGDLTYTSKIIKQ